MDIFVSLAKKAVETYLKSGKVIETPSPLPNEFRRRAGAFVSIHKITPVVQFISLLAKERLKGNLQPQELADGYQPNATSEELRGCIGTYLPVKENVALEIIHNAIHSATQDPRFFPISTGELPQLRFSIDVLSQPETISQKKDLDPKKYGLIVGTADGRKGLLLPDIEGVKTVDQQIEICRAKGDISPEEKVTFKRFTVERHKD